MGEERMTASEILSRPEPKESVEFSKRWHAEWVRPIVKRFAAARIGRIEFYASRYIRMWESGIRRLPTRRDDE